MFFLKFLGKHRVAKVITMHVTIATTITKAVFTAICWSLQQYLEFLFGKRQNNTSIWKVKGFNFYSKKNNCQKWRVLMDEC